MKKIHKVTYSDIFGPNFNSVRIDNELVDLLSDIMLDLNYNYMKYSE